MKKLIGLVLALCMLSTVPFALAEGVQPAQNAGAAITATGTGRVTIVPDFATVTLGVSTQAPTVVDAQQTNAAHVSAVIEALTAQGIAKEDLQTSYFGINPIYDYSSANADGSQRLWGYQVSNTLNVTIRDLGKVSAVLDAAMDAGANESYGLTFDSTKRAEAYDQALETAVKAAARKAGILAGAAGVTLGELLSVAEQTAGSYGAFNAAAGVMEARADTAIMNGTLAVEATAVLTYRAGE